MPTCGYTCPKCEGRGFDDQLNECDWCNVSSIENTDEDQNILDEEE
jgi:hypothetical protein